MGGRKTLQTCGKRVLTSTTPTFLGGTSHSESHLSTVTDLIVLLRHSEVGDRLRRGLVVLKMRGSRHDKEIREFTVDSTGMHIGPPFPQSYGLMAEVPLLPVDDDQEREPDTG